MKFFIIIGILTVIYTVSLAAIIAELKAHSSFEERRENQSVPLLLAVSALYLAIVTRLVELSSAGYIQLT